MNVESIRFGANEAVPISYKVIDVNNDRISDLRFSFALRETGIVCGDINATLIGEFYNEIPFLSSDSIVTKNCNGQ